MKIGRGGGATTADAASAATGRRRGRPGISACIAGEIGAAARAALARTSAGRRRAAQRSSTQCPIHSGRCRPAAAPRTASCPRAWRSCEDFVNHSFFTSRPEDERNTSVAAMEHDLDLGRPDDRADGVARDAEHRPLPELRQPDGDRPALLRGVRRAPTATRLSDAPCRARSRAPPAPLAQPRACPRRRRQQPDRRHRDAAAGDGGRRADRPLGDNGNTARPQRRRS